MKNVSDKFVKKIKTRFLERFFLSRAVYVIMWKNIVEPDRPQVTVWRTRMACWITMTTDTHSEYVIQFILPLQQILHECPSLLCNTYIDCLVILLAQIEKSNCARNWAATLNKFTNRHCTASLLWIGVVRGSSDVSSGDPSA
jgi:hypothetical protein